VSIIVPPELLKLARVDGRAMHQAAVKVVQASDPGNPRPPKFASLVGNKTVRLGDGFTAGLTGELAMGAEYGGRRKPPVTYLRKGRAVRRRTTQQFLPANARGYALTPALRRSMHGIRRRIVEAVSRVATHG
jgi:hypothetical protein